jgi:hypothetical protein
VDEWGAEGVGPYLLSELKLLALFGHSNGSRTTGQARKYSYNFSFLNSLSGDTCS